jgi:hypothetical protein
MDLKVEGRPCSFATFCPGQTNQVNLADIKSWEVFLENRRITLNEILERRYISIDFAYNRAIKGVILDKFMEVHVTRSDKTGTKDRKFSTP